MEALLKLFLLPLPIAKNTSADDEVDIIDPEDTGYQASFSKLGASEKARPDPVAYVAEPRAHLAQSLVATSKLKPGVVSRSKEVGDLASLDLSADWCVDSVCRSPRSWLASRPSWRRRSRSTWPPTGSRPSKRVRVGSNGGKQNQQHRIATTAKEN